MRMSVLVSLLCVACGGSSVQYGAEGPPRARLEVTNQTRNNLEIAADGWTLGIVKAGSRVRFEQLRPGNRQLTARPLVGTSADKQIQLKLLRGKTAMWAIAPPKDPLPMPTELAQLTLVNDSQYDIQYYIDDKWNGTLIGGDTRTLDGLTSGPQQIRVNVPNMRYTRTLKVHLEPNTKLSHTIQLETGGLRLTNNTGEAVRLRINKTSTELISKNTGKEIPALVVGVHELVAKGVNSNKEHRRTVRITQGETVNWDLTASQGQLRITNHSGEVLAVSAGDSSHGMVAVGKSLVFDQIPLGLRRITAKGQSTEYVWSIQIPITAGHIATWSVRNNVGTLRVLNQLSERIRVSVNSKNSGTVAPGQALFLDDISTGAKTVTVIGDTSRTRQTRRVTISPRESASWHVSEPKANLRVKNHTPEQVFVYLNSKPIGRATAAHDTVFTALPPGKHLIEAVGESSGDRHKGMVTISTESTTAWSVTTHVARVKITNKTDEALVASPGLRTQQREIPAGTTATYAIPVGHRIIHFIGQQSEQSYFKRFTLTAGKEVDWTVQPLIGTLRVDNTTQEEQQIRVDERHVATVPAGRIRLVELRAGPHRMVAVGTKTANAQEATINVTAGVARTWQIQISLAQVQIQNDTTETIDLRYDGQHLGVLRQGEGSIYGPFKPGVHTLAAQGRWSRIIYQREIDLQSGRTDTWQIQAEDGVVLIQNQRSEPIRMLIDSRAHKDTVDAHSERRISLPLGSHLIELIGTQSHAIYRHRLRVRPGRTYTVEAPKGDAVLVVTNQLSTPLSLFVDQTHSGEVLPKATARIPLRQKGRLTIHAKDRSGKESWHHRVEVNEHKEYHWVIQE